MFITFYNVYFPSSVTHSDNTRGNGLLGEFVCALLSTPPVPTSGIVQYIT